MAMGFRIRPTCFQLHQGCARPNLSCANNVSNFHPCQVATAKLVIDRKVKQCAISQAPHPVAGRASSDFSQQVLEDRIVQHAFGLKPRELVVLLLEQSQVPRLRHLRTAIFGLQLIEGRRVQPVLAANLGSSAAQPPAP